jgi:hypothetical protein
LALLSGFATTTTGATALAKSAKCVVEQQRPLPVALQLEDRTTTGADNASCGVQESVAQSFRFPAACLAAQTQALEEGDQVLRRANQF